MEMITLSTLFIFIFNLPHSEKDLSPLTSLQIDEKTKVVGKIRIRKKKKVEVNSEQQ